MDLNSFKNELALVSSSDDISEINNSLTTKNHCKMDSQLLPDAFQLPGIYFPSPQKLAFARIVYDKAILKSIIEQLEKKSLIPLYKGKDLKAKCNKIKNHHAFSAALGDLLKALLCPMEPSVTTRRSSPLAIEEILANYSITQKKIKNLESELQVEKRNVKSFQAMSIKTKEELKTHIENMDTLQASYTNLKEEMEKNKEEIKMRSEMYSNLQEVLAQKKEDLKKSTTTYQALMKCLKKERIQGCEKCRNLRKTFEEMKIQRASFENKIMKLKSSNNELEEKDICSRNEIKALKKQVEELKEKLFEVSPKKVAENYAIASFSFAKKTPEHPKKKDPDSKKIEEKKKECVIKNKVYDGPSTSNSMLGCSIRNRSFQTMNADDYFSASSLSELSTEEDSDEESELTFPVKKYKVSKTVVGPVRSNQQKKRK